MSIEVRPATVFDDVATLVGPKNPASNVCFCLSYRIGSKENVALRGQARAERVRELCEHDPAPGVIAYLDHEPVGWAAVHPRRDTSFARSRIIPLVDDLDVWSAWCFRVRPGYRKHGLMHVLLDGAVAHARERGAPAIALSEPPRRLEVWPPTPSCTCMSTASIRCWTGRRRSRR